MIMIHQNTKWYHLGFAPKWVWFFSWYRDFRSNRNSWALWLQVSICVCMTVKSQKEVSSKYSVAPLFKYGNEELKMQKRQFFNMVHSKNQPKCPTRSFLDVSIFVHHPKNLPTLSVAFLSGPVVRSIVLFKSGPRVGRSWAQLLHLECACETCWNGGPRIFGIFSKCRDFCFTPVRIRNSYTYD
jgi:hypothetical protein